MANPILMLMLGSKGAGETEKARTTREMFLEEQEVPDSAKRQAVPAEVIEWMESKSKAQRYQMDQGLQARIAEHYGIYPEEVAWAKWVGSKYGDELDGRGDAARHLALGWLVKQSRKNPKMAEALISAREYVPPRAKFEREQDIGNNKLGAEIEAETFEEAEAEIRRMMEEDPRVIFYTDEESRKKRGY